jgi:hypothetical protein
MPMLYPDVVHPETPLDAVHERDTEALPGVAEIDGVDAKGNLRKPAPSLYNAEVLVPVANSAIALHSLKLADVEYPLGAITGSNSLKDAELYS